MKWRIIKTVSGVGVGKTGMNKGEHYYNNYGYGFKANTYNYTNGP